MPCDTVSTYGIDLGKLDPGTLMRGLTKDGLSPVQRGDLIIWQSRDYNTSHQYNTKTGKLTVSSSAYGEQLAPDAVAAIVKQSLSRQIVREQFAKKGWQVKENGNKLTVIRNTF